MKTYAVKTRKSFVRPVAKAILLRALPPMTLLFVAAAFVSGIAALAQQSGDNADGKPISANAELVLVPVQVKDAAGKPVHGLLQSDFTLRSDGKVQLIKVFEESDGSSREADSEESSTPAKAASVEEFSSVPESGLPQQLLIIAVDQVNTPYADQGRARQELLKYLAKAPPGQSFSLVAITQEGLRQLQAFTSDPKALLKAMGEQQPKMGKAEATNELRFAPQPLCVFCSDPAAAYKASADLNAANVTLQSFGQLAQAYAGIPGRKSVVWLSAGVQIVDAIAEVLNRGNIALYPVDLNGNQTDSGYLASDNFDMTDSHVVVQQDKDDSGDMRALAAKTGGRYCTTMAALQSCIDQAVTDSTSYYMLGFYVSQQERVVGWHKLDVKLASGREKVHARSGYFLEAKATSIDKDLRQALLAAAKSQVGYTGVAFTVERLPAAVATAGSASSVAALNFRIRVPATSVMLTPGAQDLSYEIAIIPLSPKGEPVSDVQTTRLNLNPNQTQEALAKGWRYDETLAQSNTVAAVRFLVRDNGADRLGSVTVPLNK